MHLFVCVGHIQEKESNPMRGWATFGIISCMYVCLELCKLASQQWYISYHELQSLFSEISSSSNLESFVSYV